MEQFRRPIPRRRPEPSKSVRPVVTDAARLDAAKKRLAPEISAYPGSITYLDLIRRNKRESVLLIVAMILLAVLLGAGIAAGVVAWGGGRVDDLQVLLPSLVTGGIVAGVLACLGAVWSYYGGGSAILRMSGAHEIQKSDDPVLFNVVDEMRIAAGLPMPRVYIIEDSAMNAFATGRDPEHAAVAITRGLREKLGRDELQGVMAHELAHVRHYDIRFAMLMATMVGLIVFACDAFLRIGFYGARHGGTRSSRRSSRDGGGGGAAIVLVVVALVLAILAPIAARLIQMAYSRRREYLADAGAVELTRNPEGLASALLKLADDPEPLVDAANRGTAHLFIVNPLRKMRRTHQSWDSAFSSHPPVQKRVARLLALAR